MFRPRAALASTLLALPMLLAGCSGGGPWVGARIDASPDAVSGPMSTVRLPYGEFHVHLAEPVSRLDSGDTDQGDLDAGDDSFIGVRVEFEDGAGVPEGAKLDVVPVAKPALTLVSGDDTTNIPVPVSDQPQVAYVKVKGRPDDVHLDVEYDGVTQSVDLDGTVDQGDAAGLYQPTTPPSDHSCGEGDWPPGVRADQICYLTVRSLGYVDGAGWAPSGKPWTVVDLSTRVDSITVSTPHGPAVYAVTSAVDRSTLSDAPTAYVVPHDELALPEFRTGLVFPTGASNDLTITRVFTAELTSGPAGTPARRQFIYGEDLTLPAT